MSTPRRSNVTETEECAICFATLEVESEWFTESPMFHRSPASTATDSDVICGVSSGISERFQSSFDVSVDGGPVGCDWRIGISGEIGEACVLDIVEMLHEASSDMLVVRLEVIT
jgi:hypothetical protein